MVYSSCPAPVQQYGTEVQTDVYTSRQPHANTQSSTELKHKQTHVQADSLMHIHRRMWLVAWLETYRSTYPTGNIYPRQRGNKKSGATNIVYSAINVPNLTFTPTNGNKKSGATQHSVEPSHLIYPSTFTSTGLVGWLAEQRIETHHYPPKRNARQRYTYNGTRRVRQLALGCESN